MAETSRFHASAGRLLPPLILFLTLLAIIQAGSVERNFRSSSEHVYREELNELQTRLRDHLQPDSMVRSAFLRCIEGIPSLTPATLPLVRQRLENCLGSDGQALMLLAPPSPASMPDLLSPEYPIDIRQPIILGLNQGETFDLLEFNRVHWLSELHWPGSDPMWFNFAEATLNKRFGGAINWLHLFNLSQVHRIDFSGKAGFLLTALFSSPATCTPRMLGSCNEEFAGRLAPSARGGSLLAFLPEHTLSSPDWIAANLRTGIPGLSHPLFVFDPNHETPPSSFPAILVNKIRDAAVGGESGLVETADQTACFQRIPGQAQGKDRLAIVLASRAQAVSPTGNFLFLGMGLFTLTLVLFFTGLEFGWIKVWNSSLARKALLLFGLAGLFPALGVSFSLQSLPRWETILERPHAFRRLEGRLEQCENQHQLMVGEILANIRRFLAHPALRLDPPDPARLTELSFWINERLQNGRNYLIAVNAAHQRYGAYYFSDLHMQRDNATSARNRTLQMVQSLMAIMTETFRFRDEGKNKISADAVRGGIFLDWLEMLLTKKHIYKLATNQDRLVQLKFYGETVWYYLGVLFNKAMEPRFFSLFNLSRKTIQRLEISRWMTPDVVGSASIDTPPDMVFFCGEGGQTFTFPDCATRFPAIIEILSRVADEGGTRNHCLTINGKDYFAVARKLTGMDYVGMAIQPRQTPGRGQFWLTAEILGPLLYPVLIIILALLLFRSFFLEPVSDLQRGVSAIADGSLEVRLPVLTGDELGRLCVSFNRMADGLREKEFLSRFLSDLTLERVRSGAETRATRTNAAIMFSDIRGFTTISEERSAEEVVTMLNEYLSLMETAIEAHGGSIDKFIGDAIMAVFLPALGKESPGIRAVRAGLAMRQSLAEFNREREKHGTFTIRTGIGIASGEVLMGILGEGGRRDFTVTGPTVNLAASMEKRTKEASHSYVVVCKTTAEQLGDRWNLVPLPASPKNDGTAAWEIS